MDENTKNDVAIIDEKMVINMVYELRGERVMLDFDLAGIYGYTTKAFNQQVKNNIEKFEGFMFQLTKEEVDYISRSQKVTPIKSNEEANDLVGSKNLTSQKNEVTTMRSRNLTACKMDEDNNPVTPMRSQFVTPNMNDNDYELSGSKNMTAINDETGSDEDLARSQNATPGKKGEIAMRCKNYTACKIEDNQYGVLTYNVNNLARCKNCTTRKDEANSMRCQNVTSYKWVTGFAKGGRTSLPYAFTEQGIYMLMTVLRGELAIKQSRALVIIFKKMKDYIKEEHNLIGTNNLVTLVDKYHELDERVSITESKVDTLMDYFDDPTKYKEFAIKDNERIEADILFQNIYKEAKESIIIVDDYISLKTLHLLKSSREGVGIIIISDNVARNKVEAEYLEDFRKDIKRDIVIYPSDHKFHDRYIVIDYKTDNEKLYHSGPSSKDAGNSVTTITTLNDYELYHSYIGKIIGR